jgi:hypothetical protein
MANYLLLIFLYIRLAIPVTRSSNKSFNSNNNNNNNDDNIALLFCHFCPFFKNEKVSKNEGKFKAIIALLSCHFLPLSKMK